VLVLVTSSNDLVDDEAEKEEEEEEEVGGGNSFVKVWMVVLGISVGEYVGKGASDTGETVIGTSPTGGFVPPGAALVGGSVDPGSPVLGGAVDPNIAGGTVVGVTTSTGGRDAQSPIHGVGAMVNISVGGEGAGISPASLGGALGIHSIGGMGINVGQSFPALLSHGIASSSMGATIVSSSALLMYASS
jgi:hypothetical protein